MVASAEVITPGQFPATDKRKVDFGNSDDTSIDPAFVLAPEFRPGTRQEVFGKKSNGVVDSREGVPLLDLSVLRISKDDLVPSEGGNGVESLEHGRRRKVLVEEVGRACQEWGFFQVINHGVEAGLLDEVEAEMKSFFALPRDEKLRVARSDENPTVGYYDSELTKSVRDWKEVFDFTVKDTVTLPWSYDDEGVTAGERLYSNSWPSNRPHFREACTTWSSAMEKLAFELLELVTESMGLPATYFHKHFRDNNTAFVRLNHYPECPRPELALGVSRHKDSGALTVLWQDQTGGLEVRRKDSEWMGVEPRRDAFIINVGDLFQVWSNNKYVSVEHRATVNRQKDRYSIPYFFNPAHTTQIFPAPELTDEKTNSPRYRPYSWGYFLHHRKMSNMKRNIENIQIHHFAIN